MAYQEKPSTTRTRVLIAVLMWIVAAPLLMMLWYLLGWLSLLFFIGSVWLTWDYIRKGSFIDADTVTRAGGWGGKHRSGK